ncbi:hypothetical protein Dsin_020900 [Dipteronia sinensis]|uniref:Uncharacterized protein n=1 Tax=Dipteronia sinensis TaxID=43782 RepID=A0AAE0AAW1_9ROSI|nr:hypothetical protein Dsin_020900 [Dipteronia sinensis]
MALTQTQLDEAMNPAQFDSQVSVKDNTSSVGDPHLSCQRTSHFLPLQAQSALCLPGRKFNLVQLHLQQYSLLAHVLFHTGWSAKSMSARDTNPSQYICSRE